MKQLTPIQQKIVALAILAFAITMICAAIAVPLWLLNQHYDEALDDATSRLERYSKIVATRDALLKQVTEVKALESTRHFLRSASPALAAAELQQQAQAFFDAKGAKVSSIRVLSHKDEGPYRQITVQVQLSAPLSAVKGMLYGLESSHPYLFLDNFSMAAQYMQANLPPPLTEQDLVVQFDLTGYTLKGAP